MTGLNTNFTLQGGKFQLSDKLERASDRVWMLANFDGLRIYTPDYNPGFTALQQKNASYLLQYKVLILQTLANLLNKYVEEVTIQGLDIIYSVKNRKEYGIFIAYTYLSTEKASTVIFLG